MDLLVVDDDEQILSLCRRGLNPDEMKVTTAASGREALEILKKQKFDIMLTDLEMGSPGGIEVTREARKAHPEMDVMIFTGYPTIDTVINALKLGAYDYIMKPIDLMLLKFALKRCVERRAFKTRLETISEHIQGISTAVDKVNTKLALLQPGLPQVDFKTEYAESRAAVEEAAGHLGKLKRELRKTE